MSTTPPIPNDEWDRIAKELDAAVPDFDSRWHESANCATVGVEPFYATDFNRKQDGLAKSFCHHCPVMMECRADGLNESDGVWGGLNQYQRRSLRAAIRRNELDIPTRTIYSPEELGLVPSTNSYAGRGGWMGSDASLEAIGRLKTRDEGDEEDMLTEYVTHPESTDSEYNALVAERDSLVSQLQTANAKLQQRGIQLEEVVYDHQAADSADAYAGINHSGLGW